MINIGGLSIPIETAGLILSAALGLGALATWLFDRRARMVKRGGPFQRRKLRKSVAEEKTKELDPQQLAQMTRYQIEHDGLNKHLLRYHAVRSRKAKERVVGALMDFDLQFEETSARLMQYADHLKSREDPKPSHRISKPMFSPLAEYAINGGLLLGDAVIISLALQAIDQNLSLLTAVIATMAISIAIWLGGKLLGHSIGSWSEEEPISRSVGIVMAILLMVAAAFPIGWLRAEDQILWTGLAVVPALGSAGLTMLAARPKYRYEDVVKEWSRSFKRSRKAIKRLTKFEAKAGSHSVHVKNRLMRMQSLELAEASLFKIVEAVEDIHKHEKGPEILQRLLVDGRSELVDRHLEEADGTDSRPSRDPAANFDRKRAVLPSGRDLDLRDGGPPTDGSSD